MRGRISGRASAVMEAILERGERLDQPFDVRLETGVGNLDSLAADQFGEAFRQIARFG
jgi:hypothetical protein